MAKENSNAPAIPQSQQIPLSKIHELPGVFVGRQPDKTYGGLVTSIQAGGVKEPVVLRLREDGEYQLVTGYRRLRASELAKKQDIPALVYEMSIQEAQDYHHRVKNKPDMEIPGKLVPAPDQGQKADLKGPENPTPAAPAGQDMEQTTIPLTPEKGKDKPDKGTEPPTDAAQDKEKAPDPKAQEKGPAPAADDKDKGKDKPAEGVKPPADAAQDKEKAPDPKAQEKDPAPTVAELEAKVKAGETISLTELAAAEKAERQAKQDKKAPSASAGKDKPDTLQPAPAVVTSAAKGPAGTMISQVLPERLSPPDETTKKDFPSPKEGESIFVTLHPAYLVKSEYNTISVDPKSEDYQELKKSIELNGVKDPVLARIGDAGTLEIVSGQRRHMIATELNYPVPTIIQKISDPDVKILVADGNLHRPKISTHDLARSLRMKMEGMKQKSGRRKKGSFKAEELDSDVKLAQEMGMGTRKGVAVSYSPERIAV
ncbi:MAG: ParB N-terminal domain-containing protein [Clostridiales bacterium]|nr:ParB N-terminal domain-containing protein [Clostridiales bacterium]